MGLLKALDAIGSQQQNQGHDSGVRMRLAW
jgi:hypothetical protein